LPTHRLTFPGASGHDLAARLELPPSGKPLTYALFAHCFTCSKNIRAAVDLTRALCSLGLGVLRFDFTGLGESEGDFADTNFSSNVDDLEAAARFMTRELAPPSILIGHSLGGAAVLHAAARLDSVRAVATIGAPATPAHVLEHIACSVDDIERDGEATVEISGRPFRVKKQFLDDLEAQRMRGIVSGLDAALLIFHSPQDEIVGIDNAAELYAMARHPKSFVTLDEADHLLTAPGDSEYVAKVLAAWAGRYVDVQPDPDDAEELRDAERVVTRTQSGTFYTEVGVRRHSLVADEPVAVGGGDAGPTPYDYMLVALGTCTSMTLQMYAGRKGWPLEEALIRLRHRRLHAEDCERCEHGDERLDVIGREIELVGPLDDGQRQRLMEIADRCPVHRTLDAGVRIESSGLEDESR
jgi:uncharacterized OsmC-like protein/fermentation-respiration switch protein FrsA (DUF1100 family)